MFYEYDQNNSGGYFFIEDGITLVVWIQADSNEEADELAEKLGIYFNGCREGYDCECCGDRWYPAYKRNTKGEMIESLRLSKKYKERWVEEGEPWATVHFKDGSIWKISKENFEELIGVV